MYAIVIDKQGYKVEFVLLNEDKTPQYYTLKDGEAIVEDGWDIANSMNKPQWVNGEWIDIEPLPPQPPTEPQKDKITILKEEVDRLTIENDSLKARVNATENAVIDLMLTGYKA